MIELKDWADYVLLFLLAAALGGLGGLAFELMQTRRGQTGVVELPGSSRGGRYRDWGVWANVVIGAIAAVAALWVFPPDVSTTVSEAGATTTATEYDVIKVVGLSLIIGSAGSSFLSALQARALARLKEQEAQVTRQVASEQIESLKGEIVAGGNQNLVGRVEAAKSAVEATALS